MIDNTYDYITTRIIESKQMVVRTNPLLENTIDNIVEYIGDCYIENKEWKHNIHPEIIYTYCPFNSGGYTLITTIKFSKDYDMDWFDYLFNKQLDDKRNLELILVNSIDDMEGKQ